MSSILVPILVASFIGYQLDEAKLKKYEMIDETGETVKVQFSKKGAHYSCPLSCDLDHYHYAKSITDNEIADNQTWSIESGKDLDGLMQYNINGASISSYKVIKVNRMPKSAPPVAFNDVQND